MEALHLNERERTVIYEGGYIMGREEGLASAKQSIAKTMLADGMAVELVAKYSGLSLEELKELNDNS